MDTKTKALVSEQIGNPREVARQLRSFQRAARVLSSHHPRLIDRYPNQWVAVHKGGVQATGRSLRSLLSKVDSAGLPRHEVIVRFIDRNQRTLIL